MEATDIPESEAKLLSIMNLTKDEVLSWGIKQAVGCKKCNKIGYKGRKPVFEVLPVNCKEIRDAIVESGPAKALFQVVWRVAAKVVPKPQADRGKVQPGSAAPPIGHFFISIARRAVLIWEIAG